MMEVLVILMSLSWGLSCWDQNGHFAFHPGGVEVNVRKSLSCFFSLFVWNFLKSYYVT